MFIESERWKVVDGGYDRYRISDRGNVKSFSQNKTEGKLLKSYLNNDGYEVLELVNNDKIKRQFKIHRLVAQAFVNNPDPDKYKVVNHKDSVRNNNYYSNLEWCDMSYNNKYKYFQGNASCKGEKNPRATLKEDVVKDIYNIAHSSNFKIKTIAEMFQTTERIVCKIKYGETWKHITNHKSRSS